MCVCVGGVCGVWFGMRAVCVWYLCVGGEHHVSVVVGCDGNILDGFNLVLNGPLLLLQRECVCECKVCVVQGMCASVCVRGLAAASAGKN